MHHASRPVTTWAISFNQNIRITPVPKRDETVVIKPGLRIESLHIFMWVLNIEYNEVQSEAINLSQSVVLQRVIILKD